MSAIEESSGERDADPVCGGTYRRASVGVLGKAVSLNRSNRVDLQDRVVTADQ